MQMEHHVIGDVLRINVLERRIDAAVAIQFKDTVRELAEAGPARVVLDLQIVDFIDSSGLGAIVAAMKYLGKERKMELAGLQSKVEKVFRLTRMDSVFTIHDSADEACGKDASAA